MFYNEGYLDIVYEFFTSRKESHRCILCFLKSSQPPAGCVNRPVTTCNSLLSLFVIFASNIASGTVFGYLLQ